MPRWSWIVPAVSALLLGAAALLIFSMMLAKGAGNVAGFRRGRADREGPL